MLYVLFNIHLNKQRIHRFLNLQIKNTHVKCRIYSVIHLQNILLSDAVICNYPRTENPNLKQNRELYAFIQ